MTGDAAASRRPELPRRAARAGGWLRDSRAGLLAIALVVGVGSGLGAVAFRYLIYFFTWLATGHAQFGQDGHAGSSHLRWPGLAALSGHPAPPEPRAGSRRDSEHRAR
ncbi:MAG TPA: hypothetical protein VF933_05995 [Streptosporangiaceae bacterium]